MNQQNSTNNQNLLDTTIKTRQNRQLKVISLLRVGSDETLYKAQYIHDPNPCPKEFILKSQKTMSESQKAFIKNIMQTQGQSDTGIVTIEEVIEFEQQQNYILLMEMGTINLHDYIKNQSTLTIEKKIQICNNLFTPINFMHSQKFYHKDLKPESFVLIENRFKLIDFGLMMKGYDQNNSHTIQVVKTVYSAPEIIFQKYEYSEKVDSWALGCIIYEIFSGKSFFVRYESVEDLKQQIQMYQQQQDSYHKKIDQLQIPEQIQRTLKQMLDPNPQKRISILEASEAFINKQKKTQTNPVLQTQANPVLQTQTNPVLQTQTNPVLQTQTNPVLQTQTNPVLQTQTNPVLQTQTNPVLQTQANPVLQTQTNPVLQTQTNPVLQTQTNPVLQTQTNPVLQTQTNPVLQTQTNPVLQTQTNPVLQTQTNPVLQTQTNPVLQTQTNPVLQTQTNPVLQTQTNPVLQTQTNPVLQTQMNQAQLSQYTYQQPNKTQQQPTQSQASPFQQQTTQKQQLSQTNIEQVCNLLLGEIKQQISKNQNQKIENKDAKKQIRENDSKQSQNDVENAFHQINKIIHNLKKNVQEKQVQQIQEINKQYELKLEDKDKLIDQLKKQLEDKQRDIEQQIKSNNELVQESKKLQDQINNLNYKSQEQQTLIQQQEKKILEQETQIQQKETKIQEQQNLNYLVNQVIKIIQSRKQDKQEQYQNNEQQQYQNNEEETLFQKLYEELSQFDNRY